MPKTRAETKSLLRVTKMKNSALNKGPASFFLKDVFNHYWVYIFVVLSLAILFKTISYFSSAEKGSFDLDNVSYIQSPQKDDISSIVGLPEGAWHTVLVPNFDGQQSSVWMKIPLNLSMVKSETILRFSDPLVDTLDVYVVRHLEHTDMIMPVQYTGDTRPFSLRALDVPNSVALIEPSQYESTIYVRGKSKISVDLQASLWTSEDFITFHDKHTLFFGLLFGYVIALIGYCLMTYATARKLEYLWFCFFLVCYITHIGTVSGFGFQYIWPSSTEFQSIVGGVSINLLFAALTQFTKSILLPERKTFQRVFNVVVVANVLVAALSVLTSHIVFVTIGIFIVLITSLLVPLLCWGKSSNTSLQKLIVLIWIILIVACIFSTVDRYSLLPLNIDPVFILIIGFHLITLVVGLAMVHDYKVSHKTTHDFREAALKDKEKAVISKDQILTLQKQSQRQLEEQVKAQTLQLEGALQDLTSASRELESMRNLDGLTGLPNRLAFEIAMEKMVGLAIDSGEPLCIAVLDIDYFKQINDEFGHLAGDECLREFARLIKSEFNLDYYTYCRFGGEEFIVASQLPSKLIEQKMNQFKDQVEKLKVETGAGIVKFSTSVGIASKRMRHSNELRSLISSADHNLYLAKHKGRNLVVA
ncbi:sensor domain-containing diguanylate cyclase [Glaciecola sp. 2405UD65-10]|uniref:sensor domain-containing diguanylate cyclase n=1 Tax=Glaciecola sp. 2405UD65-10 TaxID=3397244 RepID=UPI003B59AB8A